MLSTSNKGESKSFFVYKSINGVWSVYTQYSLIIKLDKETRGYLLYKKKLSSSTENRDKNSWEYDSQDK